MLLFPFFFTPAFSQEPSQNNYLLHLSLKEVGVGYLRNIGKIGLGVKIGYQYPLLKKNIYLESGSLLRDIPNNLLRFLTYEGCTAEVIVEIATSPNGNRHILSTGYGETSTGTFIEDPGKYAGSNSSRYAEYSQDFSSVFLKYNYLIRLTDHLNISPQIGIDRRSVSQKYAYEGSYGDHEAVNRIEKFNKFYLLFDISLVYILNNK